MQLSERVQVSLPFETEDELDLYQKVVRPLRQNRQLRQTLLDLLSLVRDKPLEVEALLNGENLVAQDQYSKDFINRAKLLEQNLINVNSKLHQTYHDMASTPVDSMLSGIIKNPLHQTQNLETSQPATPELGVLNTDELKQQITQSVMNSVLPSIKTMLDDLKKESITHNNNTTPISAPVPEDKPIFTPPTPTKPVSPQPTQPTPEPVTEPLEPAPTSGFQIRDFDEDEEDLLNLGNTENTSTQNLQSVEQEPTNLDAENDFITKMMLEAAQNSLG